jgi:hypothetical protein
LTAPVSGRAASRTGRFAPNINQLIYIHTPKVVTQSAESTRPRFDYWSDRLATIRWLEVVKHGVLLPSVTGLESSLSSLDVSSPQINGDKYGVLG